MALDSLPLNRYYSQKDLEASHTEGAHVLWVEPMKKGEMLEYFNYDVRIFGQEKKKIYQYADIIIDQAWIPMPTNVVDATYTSWAEVQAEYNRLMPKVGEESDPIDNDWGRPNDGKGTDAQESQQDINVNPITRPGMVNENVFEDLSMPKRYMFQTVRLGFMDGHAWRVGNEEFQYQYYYGGKKKGFRANNNGYMIWQLHMIMTYAKNREASAYYPKNNLFKNLGFLTLTTNPVTGTPELSINDALNLGDVMRWMDIHHTDTDVYSHDKLTVDFHMTSSANRMVEPVHLKVDGM